MRILTGRSVDRVLDTLDRSVQVRAAVVQNRWRNAVLFGSAQNTGRHFPLKAVVVALNDVVVFDMHQLVFDPKGIEHRDDDRKSAPVVLIVEIAIVAECDSALEAVFTIRSGRRRQGGRKQHTDHYDCSKHCPVHDRAPTNQVKLLDSHI